MNLRVLMGRTDFWERFGLFDSSVALQVLPLAVWHDKPNSVTPPQGTIEIDKLIYKGFGYAPKRVIVIYLNINVMAPIATAPPKNKSTFL